MVERKRPNINTKHEDLGKKAKHKEMKTASLVRMKIAKEKGTVETIGQKLREKSAKKNKKAEQKAESEPRKVGYYGKDKFFPSTAKEIRAESRRDDAEDKGRYGTYAKNLLAEKKKK